MDSCTISLLLNAKDDEFSGCVFASMSLPHRVVSYVGRRHLRLDLEHVAFLGTRCYLHSIDHSNGILKEHTI